jgi:hypothetical protein
MVTRRQVKRIISWDYAVVFYTISKTWMVTIMILHRILLEQKIETRVNVRILLWSRSLVQNSPDVSIESCTKRKKMCVRLPSGPVSFLFTFSVVIYTFYIIYAFLFSQIAAINTFSIWLALRILYAVQSASYNTDSPQSWSPSTWSASKDNFCVSALWW